MDSRFKKIDLLKLSDVETEIYTMIEIIGDRIPTDEEFEYVNGLIKVAKSLGSRKDF